MRQLTRTRRTASRTSLQAIPACVVVVAGAAKAITGRLESGSIIRTRERWKERGRALFSMRLAPQWRLGTRESAHRPAPRLRVPLLDSPLSSAQHPRRTFCCTPGSLLDVCPCSDPMLVAWQGIGTTSQYSTPRWFKLGSSDLPYCRAVIKQRVRSLNLRLADVHLCCGACVDSM